MSSVAGAIADLDARSDALGAVDRERSLGLAARALRDGAALPPEIEGASRVVVRGLHDLFPSRVELLDALAARLAPRAEVVVELSHAEGAGSWFRATARLLGQLEARGAAATLTVLPVGPLDEDRLGARVARAVAMGTAFAGGDGEGPDDVAVVHACDADDEHRVVARTVRAWVDAGVPPERIAVAARSLERHAGPLASALTAAGVPSFVRCGTPASLLPPVRFVLDAAATALTGFDRGAVGRLLSSAHAPRWAHAARTSRAEVARTLARVGVRPTSAGDAAELLAALARLEPPEAARGSGHEPSEGGSPASRVARAVASLVEAAAPLAQPGTLRDLTSRVRALAASAGVGERALPSGVGRTETRTLLCDDGADALSSLHAAALGRDWVALEVLESVLAAIDASASSTSDREPRPAADLLALLEDSLHATSVPSPGLRGGAVRILALREAAGLDLEALVVVGLADGETPAPPSDDPLLGLVTRARVARALASHGGDALVSAFGVREDARMGEVVLDRDGESEPLAFLIAIASAKERLLFTHAAADTDGRPVAPSPYLEEVEAALGQAARVVHRDVASAASVSDAAGVDEVRRALVTALAEVAPGTSARRAAAERLTDRVAPLEGHDALGLRSLLARAEIERRRIAGMLAPSEVPKDSFGGNLRGSGAVDAVGPEVFSPSALEELAGCPFAFFAHRVLGLSAEDTATDDPDPRQRGTLAHACFEAAMRALLDQRLVPYRSALAARAVDVARAAADEHARTAFAALPLDPAFLGVVRRDVVDKVARVVQALYLADDEFEPSGLEVSFGGGDGDDWPALAIGTSTIRGRIDLVDRRGEVVRVSDLKTATLGTLREGLRADRLGYVALQLPLYAAAARRVGGAARVDARYLSLGDGKASDTIRDRLASRAFKGDARSDADLLDVVSDDGEPTALAARVSALVARVRDGDFEVRPVEGACARCDFASVCRIPRGAPELLEESE